MGKVLIATRHVYFRPLATARPCSLLNCTPVTAPQPARVTASHQMSSAASPPKSTTASGQWDRELHAGAAGGLTAVHSELEHLIGEDRGVDHRGPRSDFEFALGRAIGGGGAAVAYRQSFDRFR
jgi:hypothetical protein